MSLDVRLRPRPRPFTRPRTSPPLPPSSTTKSFIIRLSRSAVAAPVRSPNAAPPSPVPDIAVAEVLQALVTAIAAMTKKRFDESKAFEHYGMICLALDDIVVDGHVESVSWDQIRRTAKMKLAAET